MSLSMNSSRLLLSVLALFVVCGCSREGPVRHEITGNVTLKGKPLDEGIITFMPQENQGTQDGATILKGAYRIPQDKGLFTGHYKVIIIGGDGRSGAGKAEPGERPPGYIPGSKERVPPEYNKASKQIVEVTKDGPNRFDFNIP